MILMKIAVFLLMLTASFGLFAQEKGAQTTEVLFTEATKNYVQGRHDEAVGQLREVLKKDPYNAEALYNLALAESERGHQGLALAYLRRALNLSPRFTQAYRAVKSVSARLPNPEIVEPSSFYELMRLYLLRPVPLAGFYFLLLFTFTASVWFLLRWRGEKIRQSLGEEVDVPLPLVTWVFVVAFILMVPLTSTKLYELRVSRATVIQPKIEVRAGPEEAAAPLFELREGIEVIVITMRDQWTQVRQPSGYTGWVPKSALVFY